EEMAYWPVWRTWGDQERVVAVHARESYRILVTLDRSHSEEGQQQGNPGSRPSRTVVLGAVRILYWDEHIMGGRSSRMCFLSASTAAHSPRSQSQQSPRASMVMSSQISGGRIGRDNQQAVGFIRTHCASLLRIVCQCFEDPSGASSPTSSPPKKEVK
ncbi:hypothetical protein FOZ63_013816, partial [Perkinsus olseni]